MTGDRLKLLVTGGTGVLGPRLVGALGSDRCIVLRHRTPVEDPAVETIDGDLSQERFGLSRAAYERLAGRICGIVHAGALTSSFWKREQHEDVNVDGTQRVVALAEHARVPLHHVSTFYVLGRDGTEALEATDVYQASKREAEGLVADAGVPTAIYRLPILIGDAATGVIPRFSGQAFYFGAKAIASGNAHIIPAAPGSRFDFLPRDYVAACLQVAIDGDMRGICWITAGERALPFADFIEACAEEAEASGHPVVRPKVMAPDVIERLVLPAFGDELPAQMRKQLELANRVMRGMSNEAPLPDSRDQLPDGVAFPPLPDLHACLRASLRYWLTNVRLPRPIGIPAP